MADNVAITAGSGTDVATDQVSGTNEHVQVVKLAIAADGSRVALPGDATDGLLVNLGSNNDVVVTATDLDIRNLVLANDAVKVGDGTSLIDIDTAPTDGETNGGKRLLHTEAWLWGFNGTTWDRLRSDTTNGLDVDVTRVSGSVTVAQATAANLNVTEASAAAIKTAVEIMDDWDESDRAKVNLVVGQAGITAGAGAVAANTPRVTHASDDPVTTSVQLLDDTVLADDAAFTAGTTKVIMSGFVLDNTSTDALDENDAGAARITTDRRQIVQLGESGSKYVKGGGSKTDTSAQSLMAASGDAATSNYLCWVTIYNSSATNTAVEIRDGTTTVVAVIPAPAYGGATFVPTYPIKMTANTATNAYAQTGVTTLYVYGGGYTCV